MQQLSHLLSRFGNLVPPTGALKKTIARAIHDIAGVPITQKDISFSNNVVFIKCSSIAKNAIRLVRAAILSEVNREHPKSRDSVRDIR